MAPQLAVAALESLPPGAIVLDPMCGSGTALHAAASRGFTAYGFDVDPLAVLLAKVATSHVLGQTVRRAALRVVQEADSSTGAVAQWIAADQETLEFTEFWFGESQRSYLHSLAVALAPRRGPAADALRVALSRTIVTKDRGASLARDVSHSRPHKVGDSTDYDVRAGFLAAADKVAGWMDDNRVAKRSAVSLGDSRRLPKKLGGAVDLVITSPPYLNAIDYLRGHRLALVWLGHQLPRLRAIRSASVGTERGLSDPGPVVHSVARAAAALGDLPQRERRMMYRYCTDLVRVCFELERVLMPGGELVAVVGNSNLRGVFVSNSDAFRTAAERSGLTLVEERVRDLPTQHRYLPPPTSTRSTLAKRMKTETVLRLSKPH